MPVAAADADRKTVLDGELAQRDALQRDIATLGTLLDGDEFFACCHASILPRRPDRRRNHQAFISRGFSAGPFIAVSGPNWKFGGVITGLSESTFRRSTSNHSESFVLP